MYTDDIPQYILSFLLRESVPIDIHGSISGADFAQSISLSLRVGYCTPQQAQPHHRIVIVPSGFFDYEQYGRAESIPRLPLLEWHGIPILFGSPREQYIETPYGTRLIIYADLVASSYFLISRYEEIYRRGRRDQYGRFPGRDSLPYRAGFINRPIVDEYGEQLRMLMTEMGLSVPAMPKGFGSVLLTHDLDQPYYSSGIRGLLRLLIKEHRSLSQSYRMTFGKTSEDKYYSYARFLDWNVETQRKCADPVKSIFFLKTPSTHSQDKPHYNLRGRKMRVILRLARRRHVEFGLHSNFACSEDPHLIESAKMYLEKKLRQSITMNRHHYLAIREPEDYNSLITAGIYHDYSMGYADVAGFRLGTCRPVRFINPQSRAITDLILHPLTMMDYTLHDEKYMHLNFSEASLLAHRLVAEVYRHGGELNLLFHNENLILDAAGNYHSRLYREILRQVVEYSPAVEVKIV